MLGSGMATIMAAISVLLIITISYLISYIIIGDKQTYFFDERVLPLEDVTETISLLKTKFEVDVDGEKANLTLLDLLELYSYEEISSDLIEDKINKTLKSTYGNCYAFEFKSSETDKNLKINLRSRSRSYFSVVPRITRLKLPFGEVVFTNFYSSLLNKNYRLYKEKYLEITDRECVVENVQYR